MACTVCRLFNHIFTVIVMEVFINGQSHTTTATTLGALLEERQLPPTGIAVGLNGRMVPRTQWAASPLSEGDKVVIIKAACGG